MQFRFIMIEDDVRSFNSTKKSLSIQERNLQEAYRYSSAFFIILATFICFFNTFSILSFDAEPQAKTPYINLLSTYAK